MKKYAYIKVADGVKKVDAHGLIAVIASETKIPFNDILLTDI